MALDTMFVANAATPALCPTCGTELADDGLPCVDCADQLEAPADDTLSREDVELRARVADRDSERPTLRVPPGSPCRVVSGCGHAAIGNTGRCEMHAGLRPTPVPTVGRI